MSEENQNQVPPIEFAPTGEKLTGDQIKWGYWITTHKLMLRRIGILALIAFDILIFLFIFYGFLNIFVLDRKETLSMHRELTSDKINYEYLQSISQPSNLEISKVEVLKNSDNYDFFAELNNINEKWYVSEIVYHFEADDFESEQKTTYVLPLQQKFIMELGVESEKPFKNPTLIIDSMNQKKQFDYNLIKEEFFQFEIIDPKFISSTQSGLSENVGISTVEFTVENQSAYNYWDMKFKVLLYSGNKLVYINEIPMRTIDSGEKKVMSFNVFEKIRKPDKVYVFPDIDFLNEESLRGFED
jgi:hypothetical protein